MTENSLSQEEINALMGKDNSNNYGDILTNEQKDALGEIGNISFGSSATALSELLRNKTEINAPTVTVTTIKELEEEFGDQYVSIKVNYIEGIDGENVLIVNTKDAAVIANLMMGGDGTGVTGEEVGEMELSAVQEAMNQMMGKSATSMSTIFNKKVDISPPEIQILDMQSDGNRSHIPSQDPVVKIAFQLKIGDLIDSEVMMLLEPNFAKSLVENLMNSNNEPDVEEAPTQVYETRVAEKQITQPKEEPVKPSPTIQTATFTNFSQPTPEGTENNLDFLYDIPLQVSVELGRTKRSVKDILELRSGSIIELDRLAGEHVDILVNNKLIAKGEVVVIEENFGVRVTDILSPKDRMKTIR